MKKRKHLLSLTKKDFEITTFRSGGKGGQHQNKTDSGVRIKHIESGIAAESRDGKSQHQNKKQAFLKLTKSPSFQMWLKMKSIQVEKQKTLDQEIDDMLKSENLKIEVKENGKWVETNKLKDD